MTTLALRHRAINHKLKSVSFPRINYVLGYTLAVTFFLAMLILYTININQLTRGTYLIKDYNKDINSLVQENNTLQNQFAQSDFLEAVQQRAGALSFEKTSQVQYVQVLENSLGMAK